MLFFNIVKIDIFQVSKEPEPAATITKPQTEAVSLASDKVSMHNTQMAYNIMTGTSKHVWVLSNYAVDINLPCIRYAKQASSYNSLAMCTLDWSAR